MFETHTEQNSIFIWIPFYFKYLRTLTAYRMLICCTFVSSGKLAQLIERGALNGKVMCSMLKE